MAKSIKRLLRILLFTFIAVILLFNVFIVLSGRYYLYTGIYQTYLQGRTGPGIYDLHNFPYRTLKHSSHPISWKKSKRYNTIEPKRHDMDYINAMGTSAFLVIKGDEIVYEYYNENHSKSAVSNAFSATKTVVAFLIGIAIDEGKIKSLDEKVGNYIPEFKEKGREKITIRHLLVMASGLDWEESGKNPLSENAESYYGTDLYGLVTRQHVVAEPGKVFNYQSGNTQLLGFVIKKATGKSVSDYCREKILEPIGAESDAYWSLDKENGDEKSFCCLYATARDFAKIGKILMYNGLVDGKRIVSEKFMREAKEPAKIRTEEGWKNLRYALHLWVYYDKKSTVHYFRGLKGQYIITVPDEDLMVIRLGNQRDDNYIIPEDKMNDRRYIKRHLYQVEHSVDVFRYLKIGRDIVSKK
ncbi:MAG: beta-lactamase family protein [Cryomorphaceae bacterium]|jgi:CubicO group peptidase (beta-lactamase class C family)|nr:beta-lactamase family protein [Cryomorphaceae bacterium]